MREIRNHKKSVETAIKKLKEDNTVKTADKDIIFHFVEDYGLRKNLKDARIIKYLQFLPIIARRTPDLLSNPSEKLVKHFIKSIKEQDYSEYTKESYVKGLKSFMRWYKKQKKNKKNNSLSNLNYQAFEFLEDYTYKKDHNKIEEKDTLTEEEVKKMISVCTKARDRGIIALFYETGMRLEELLQLQIKHILPQDTGYLIKIRVSKTLKRDNRLIHGSLYLKEYLEELKNKNDNDYLIMNDKERNGELKPLSDRAVEKIISQTKEKAGIKKRVTPHVFRHTCATNKANLGWNEAQMNKWFGWSDNSRMASWYVKQKSIDVIGKAEEDAGIKQPKKQKDEALKPIGCSNCGTLNTPTTIFCKNLDCGVQLLKQEDTVTLSRKEMARAFEVFMQQYVKDKEEARE